MLDIASIKPAVESIHIPHTVEINCENTSQGLKPLIISYQANQPVDLQLWDGNFCLIFLFGIENCLEGNTKNVTCSLLRITIFIK